MEDKYRKLGIEMKQLQCIIRFNSRNGKFCLSKQAPDGCSIIKVGLANVKFTFTFLQK